MRTLARAFPSTFSCPLSSAHSLQGWKGQAFSPPLYIPMGPKTLPCRGQAPGILSEEVKENVNRVSPQIVACNTVSLGKTPILDARS